MDFFNLSLKKSIADKLLGMSDLITISRSKITRSGNNSIITINLPIISERSDQPNNRLLIKYLSEKINKDEYQFPKTRIQVMKGKFFYDSQLQRYGVDPTNWWYSEKLDGIRAIWTGKRLLTRNRKEIYAPIWFIKDFPSNIALDGELYIGRQQFHQVQSAVLDHHPKNFMWKSVKFCVFDIPDATNLTFEEVQHILHKNVISVSHLQIILQERVNTLDHLLQIQKSIVIQGGEGTMLRRPGSSYIAGETSNLLKFKTNMELNKMVHLLDDDAIIVGYKYNYNQIIDGKPIMRSLLARWADQEKFKLRTEFSVGLQITKDQKRGNYQKRFPIGNRFKVIYNQLFDSQKPRFPRFGGIIIDKD